MPNRIAFSDIVRAATQNFITSENPTYRSENLTYWAPVAAASMVIKWFYSPQAAGTTLSEVHALYQLVTDITASCLDSVVEILSDVGHLNSEM